MPETPPAVDYIREMHEDDPLLMEFADIIERNPGLWHLMSMLHQVGQDLGDGVVEWHADTDAVLHDVIRTRLKVVLNNKRGTSLARSR